MSIESIEDIDRIWRQHRRYTGDGLPGEPVNAPLPIGDPSSGNNNPDKAEIREGLKSLVTDIVAAIAEAEAARDAALAAVDEFDDLYLGPKATAPTLDNDGDALQAGAIYYDTTAEGIYVWSGTEWTAAPQGPPGTDGIDGDDVQDFWDDALPGLDIPSPTDVAAPSVFKSAYTGNMTLTTADDWQRIVRRHDGRGVIDLEDGVYTATGNILLDAQGKLSIRAVNLGGATIRGLISLAHQGLYLEGVNLDPQTGPLLRADESWIEFRDVRVDASQSDTSVLAMVNGGHMRITSSARIAVWTIGPSVADDMLDIDGGAALKVIGGTTNHIQVDLLAGINPDFRMITLDTAKAMLSQFRAFSREYEDNTETAGRGVEVRRGSTLVIQGQNNRFYGFDRAIVVRQGSMAHVTDTTFQNVETGFTVAPISTAIYENASVSFTDYNGSPSSVESTTGWTELG